MTRATRMPSRIFACTVAAALTLAPIHPALAAPEGETVEELYPLGQEKFDGGDFAGAAEAWDKAVRLLPENKKNTETRVTLMNLALDAYLRAYKASNDRKFIDDAKSLLDDYEKALQEANGTVELTPEIADAKQKVDDTLAEIKAEEERKAAEEAEKNKPQPEPEPEPEPESKKKPGQGLVIGGAAMLGVGAVGIGLLLGGVIGSLSAQSEFNAAESGSDERAAAKKKGETMNALGITGAVVAPVFLGAGIALLIIGLKKNKAAAKGKAMVVPTFGPGYAGVAATMRF